MDIEDLNSCGDCGVVYENSIHFHFPYDEPHCPVCNLAKKLKYEIKFREKSKSLGTEIFWKKIK